MEVKSKSSRIPELDGLRGLAILSVLIWHYIVSQLMVTHPFANVMLDLLSFTWSGVDLFFVLSGFLIGGILIDNRRASNYFHVFYIRRACRILPLYFFWLTLFIIITLGNPVLSNNPALGWLFSAPLPLWSYSTFTQNLVMVKESAWGANWLGVTWSLAIEEQFYLILPLIIRFIPFRNLPYFLGSVILASPALRAMFILFNTEWGFFPSYLLMPCRADALMSGVLCAYFLRHDNIRTYLISHLPYLYGICGFFSVGLMLLLLKKEYLGSIAMTTYGYTLFALFYSSVLLIALLHQRGFLSVLAQNHLLRNLGVIAYGVYMFHQGVSGLAHGLILGQSPRIQCGIDALVTFGALILTLSFAGLSWIKFEQIVIKRGQSLKYCL